jgi:glycosyltransferase involved in cell wall biosynthesis
MKLLFIDPCGWPYDTTTPYLHPLGGAQSAVCYLAKSLVEMGHEATVINEVEEPRETDGVRFTHLPCSSEELNGFDVIISVAKPLAQSLRQIGVTKPIVMWSPHSTDQPCVQPLGDPAERDLYAGFAMVSAWQANTYVAAFGLDPKKIGILRNAVAPAFMESKPSARWIRSETPPVFGYSSTPYRGLDILLLSFAAIRKRLKGATLRIFSGMGIYNASVKDEFSSLYDLAHTMEGVSYVGPLPQPVLAKAMLEVDIWAYPCTFAETSCIAAMEAMASGAVILSTTLGALPETTGEFGHLIDLSGSVVPGMTATRFADHVVQEAEKVKASPEASIETIVNQVNFARQNYNWQLRAAEWIAWLERII